MGRRPWQQQQQVGCNTGLLHLAAPGSVHVLPVVQTHRMGCLHRRRPEVKGLRLMQYVLLHHCGTLSVQGQCRSCLPCRFDGLQYPVPLLLCAFAEAMAMRHREALDAVQQRGLLGRDFVPNSEDRHAPLRDKFTAATTSTGETGEYHCRAYAGPVWVGTS
jgi:hypothetical protein